MAKNHSFLRSVTLTVLAILFATLTADAAYKWTLSVTKRGESVTLTNYNSSVCGVGYNDVMFTVQSTSAAKPKFGWVSATSETTVTAGTKEANTIASQYAQGSIAMDDNGHLVIGETLNKANQMTRYFYWTTPSRSGKTVSLSAMSNTTTGCMVSQQTVYDCGNDNTSNPTKAFRVTGNITNGGKIWLAPKGLQQFVVLKRNSYCKTDDEGFATSSNRKYTFSYTANTTYASVCPYDGGSKALLNTGNAMYDITSIPSASGSVSGTQITIANLTYAKNGPVMFMLRGHKVLATSLDGTGTKYQGFYDVTEGVTAAKAVELGRFATRQNSAGWYSTQSVDGDANSVDVYAYLGGTSGTAYAITYRVTAAHSTVEAPSIKDGSTVLGTTYSINDNKSITITVPSGTIVYYTTDGTTPAYDPDDSSNNVGTKITANKTITVSKSTTIKARAFFSGYQNKSSVTTTAITYTVKTPSCAEGTSITEIANSKQINFSGTSTGATIYYQIDGGSWQNGTIATVSGIGSHTVLVQGRKTDCTTSSNLTVNVTLRKPAAPTISGTSPFDNSTTVTMAAGADGGTIYYTTDGSTPTTSSSTYSSALPCSATTTYKAICVVNGVASDVTSATFTRSAALAAPTISPTSNTYDNDLTATITAASGATIYYRVNGGAWQTYSSGISVTANNTTIEAYAVKAGNSDSPIASATYNFTCLTPTASPAAGIYNSVQSVTLSCGTTGATIHYTTDGSTPNSSSPVYSSAINVSTSMTVKAIAIKSGYTDSDVLTAEYVLNLNPEGSVSNLALAYSPVIGKSANNPTADLIRYDGTISFTAAPATSNGWTLDHYVVTVSDGTHYATTAAGAAINGISLDAAATSLAALNFKVGSTYTASVTAVYSKSGSTYSTSAVAVSPKLEPYSTYAPSMSVKTYVQPAQEQLVWWGGQSHRCYFDVYRVEITITDAEAISTIPVSYYQLQVSKDNGSTWQNVVDRTIDNLLDPTEHPATTYPAISGATQSNRYPGNYIFNANKIDSPSGEGRISFSYYYAFDVTSSALSVTDPSQENPNNWRYRITAVYGSGEDLTTSEGTPVTTDASMIQYSDGASSSSPATDAIDENSPIITGVDGVAVDRNVKEIRYFDLRGVRLNEAPSSGFYIEVRLMNDGRVVTSKRIAK